ncbi:MAG: response regulator [Mariprofundaceae bacterium]|nr:response regulator [Mariprofundaceae bacterium]
MSILLPLFRFYILPVLVLAAGCLLSWTVFEYEYIQENKQFQEEYAFRAQDHTAGILQALDELSGKTLAFKELVEETVSVRDNRLSLEDFDTYKDLIFGNINVMQDVDWIEYVNLDGAYDEDKVVDYFQLSSPLEEKESWSDIPNFVIALRHAVKTGDMTSLMYTEDGVPWVIEVYPITQLEGKIGVLVISWNFSMVVEDGVAHLPVAGQDIRYTFLDGARERMVYEHVSRSRSAYPNSTDKRKFYWQENISYKGLKWRLNYDAAPAFLASHPIVNAWNMFYGGLLMSGLLSLLTLLIYRRTRTIQALVSMRTQQLKSSQKRVSLLIDSLAEGLFDMDKEGVCTFINQRALDLLGYQDANQVIGQHIHTFIHHSDVQKNIIAHEDCQIAAVMDTAVAVRVDDEVFWRADGSPLTVSYHATPVHDDAGAVVSIVVSFLDISAQLVAENEREQMRKQVEHTQRLESLGVLAGGIAHDFNNLLSTIMGNASLAVNHLGEADVVMKHMQRIHKACSRAADLCQQMLAYSGQGDVKKESLNLSELVQDMGQLLEVTLSKGIVLDFHLADPIKLMDADIARIQQIVMNLLTNANEAMGDKQGNIRLTTGVMDVNQDFLQGCYANTNMNPGRYVFFEVHDHGCGMDYATSERIFEPFFTTKFTGRGLGMSAVLGIVRAHDGVLKMDSVVGKGTCIRILFPALDEESSLLPPQQASYENLPSDVIQHAEGLILVVDDEESLREIAGLMLEDMGYQVLFAENGLQALDVFAQYMNDIDLVLLDLTMPKMGGEACMEALQELRADIPVLISSGYSGEEHARFKHFLPKPYSEGLFQEKVNAALGK